MNIPKKIYLTDQGMVVAKFKLPNEKLINIRRGTTYRTEDQEELNFFSKQKGIGISDIDGKELKRFIAQQTIPTVDNVVITADMVDQFKWTTEAEAALIAVLKEKGYAVISADDFSKVVENPTGILDILLPKKEEIVPAKPVVKKAPVKRAPARRRAVKK